MYITDVAALYWGEGWYFRARKKFLAQRLSGIEEGSRILDIGCGNGLVSSIIPHCDVTAIDPEPTGFSGATKGFAEALSFPDATFDAVSCFDVLEHVQDHDRAMREILRVLRPGGSAHFTVPLWPALWSRHDEAAGHVRRYRPGELRRHLVTHGFKVRTVRHFISLLLPAVTAVRFLKPNSGVCSAVRSEPVAEMILDAISNLEAITGGRLPLGLTEYVFVGKEI